MKLVIDDLTLPGGLEWVCRAAEDTMPGCKKLTKTLCGLTMHAVFRIEFSIYSLPLSVTKTKADSHRRNIDQRYGKDPNSVNLPYSDYPDDLQFR